MRTDGRVGTRNHIGIIATVNCFATVCRAIAARAQAPLLPDLPNVGGFVTICHDSGCGMAGTGEAFELLQRTIEGYIKHPNFGAVLLVGLGCEVNQIKAYADLCEPHPQRLVLSIQDAGGSTKAIDLALQQLSQLAPEVNQTSIRQEVPVSKLCVGLQCGGSDGLSGGNC